MILSSPDSATKILSISDPIQHPQWRVMFEPIEDVGAIYSQFGVIQECARRSTQRAGSIPRYKADAFIKAIGFKRAQLKPDLLSM
jgi:hypothetical protein